MRSKEKETRVRKGGEKGGRSKGNEKKKGNKETINEKLFSIFVAL